MHIYILISHPVITGNITVSLDLVVQGRGKISERRGWAAGRHFMRWRKFLFLIFNVHLQALKCSNHL